MKKISLILVAVLVMCLTGCGSSIDYYVNEAFVSEDTDTITYETEGLNVTWGEYQVDKDSLEGRCVELSAGGIFMVTEEEFVTASQKFKDKMDVLKVPYAVGFSGERADRLSIQIDAEKIGLPILALLNINGSYENSIVSGMGDFKVSNLENFQYEMGDDGDYIISVTVPEMNLSDFNKYCAENVGKTLYLKLGNMTFSSGNITEETTENVMKFKGMSFLGKNAVEKDYEVIMELAQYVVNTEYTTPHTSISFGLSIEGETLYGIPYITELDEDIVARVGEKYPDVTFRRRGVENRISFEFDNSSKEVLETEDYFEKIEDIYTMCNFDGGAYSDISFSWSSCEKNGYGDSVSFYKNDGKMICVYVSERIEAKANANPFLSSHMKED